MFTLAMAEDSHDDALRVKLLLDRCIDEGLSQMCLLSYENGR